MELTVDEVLASLKNILTRQEDLQNAQEALHNDVHKIDAQTKLLLGSTTVSEDDRNKLIEGISTFVAETYKRTVMRTLRAQGREGADTEEGAVELDLTGGGFPRMA